MIRAIDREGLLLLLRRRRDIGQAASSLGFRLQRLVTGPSSPPR